MWSDRLRVPLLTTGCRTCGLLFSSPQPSSRRLERYYGAGGDWARSRAGKRPGKVGGRLVERLDAVAGIKRPPAGAKALDVGCGQGRWLNTLADYGWETYGIDPAVKVAFARHRELASIPEAATFDLVILHHVLEHLRAPGRMLRQVGSALKPGGWLFISVPSLDNLPRHRDWRYCLNGRGHIAAFTTRCVEELLARAGMSLALVVTDESAPSRCRVLARREPGDPALEGDPLAPALDALQAADLLLERTV